MITLRKAYSSAAPASYAVTEPQCGGLPGPDIRLLTGCCLHDIRREPVGTFAGAAGPNARGGPDGGIRRLRRQGAGSFAGDADRTRHGAFADADRVVIVTYADGTERSRVVGQLALQRLLPAAGVHDGIAGPVVDELLTGHAVVLVEVTEILPRDAHALLDRLEQAA
jgi:hypothetical protein